MSFKKIKVITPENVRVPENGYVYLGYGYSTTYEDTAPWIKKSDGSIILISGGTGGGGGTLYWTLESGYLKPNNVNYKVSVGNTSATQVLNVGGGINLSNTTTNTSGSIRWNGSDFQGYTGSRWVSLTASGDTSGTTGSEYWQPVAQGIQYPDGKVYVGSSFTISENNDILNVQGGVTLSNSTKTNAGTIQYNTSSTDIEGYVGGEWKSLTAGDHTANENEFIYNDASDNLVGTSKLMYNPGTTGVQGIGIDTSTSYSTFEVNGSFGTKSNVVTSSITLDENYHTIICYNTTEIVITLPEISDSVSREYVICRYNTGNVLVRISQAAEPYYTEYINFYGNSALGTLDFSTSLPAGASDKLILYSVTVRAIPQFPSLTDARWVVTNFASASTP